MIGFEKKNVNPKNRKTCDCVIRALTVATGENYNTIYKQLFDISLTTGYMINEKRVSDKLAEKYGFVKFKQPRKIDGKKYTIGEIDKLISINDTVIISCANHLTVVKSHNLIDSWDCRSKCISNYYVKK